MYLAILLSLAILATRDLQAIPADAQNFVEYVLEFIRDLTRTQIGEEEYRPWVPFVGTMFLFIFVSNWSGAFFLGGFSNYQMVNLLHPLTILILQLH